MKLLWLSLIPIFVGTSCMPVDGQSNDGVAGRKEAVSRVVKYKVGVIDRKALDDLVKSKEIEGLRCEEFKVRNEAHEVVVHLVFLLQDTEDLDYSGTEMSVVKDFVREESDQTKMPFHKVDRLEGVHRCEFEIRADRIISVNDGEDPRLAKPCIFLHLQGRCKQPTPGHGTAFHVIDIFTLERLK